MSPILIITDLMSPILPDECNWLTSSRVISSASYYIHFLRAKYIPQFIISKQPQCMFFLHIPLCQFCLDLVKKYFHSWSPLWLLIACYPLYRKVLAIGCTLSLDQKTTYSQYLSYPEDVSSTNSSRWMACHWNHIVARSGQTNTKPVEHSRFHSSSENGRFPFTP